MKGGSREDRTFYRYHGLEIYTSAPGRAPRGGEPVGSWPHAILSETNEFPRDALPSTVSTRVVSRMFGRTFAVLVGDKKL